LPYPRFKFYTDIKDTLSDCVALFKNQSDAAIPQLKDVLCAEFNRSHCDFFSSFRMSVYYFLKALKLSPGSEVIITPIHIPDLVNVILLLELKPIFVDLSLNTHSICESDLDKKLTNKTRVVINTYLSGIVPNSSNISSKLSERSIFYIEDISQAYFSSNMDKYNFQADILMGSLSPGKLIQSYTGGFILYNKAVFDLAQVVKNESTQSKRFFLRQLRKTLTIQIFTSRYIFPIVYAFLYLSWCFAPNLLKRLKHVSFSSKANSSDEFYDQIPKLRKSIPSTWKAIYGPWQARCALRSFRKNKINSQKRKQLGKLLLSKLDQKVIKIIPQECFNSNFNFYHLPIYASHKRLVLHKMILNGLDSEGYGLNLCTQEAIFAPFVNECSNAKFIKNHCIFIPLHETYTIKDIANIAKGINNVFKYNS
jgi:dTDP-4-amino-4,6-dideoxygalactose transaminase